MALESALERRFTVLALKHGCLSIKLVNIAKRGWPDRSILCPGGHIFFIEFKARMRDDLSPHQRKWRKIIEHQGFKYYRVWDFAQAHFILMEELEKPAWIKNKNGHPDLHKRKASSGD